MALFLVGYMGCGKSSIGRRIAKYLEWDFVDMDSVIEQEYGASVSEIFAREGEARFREMERTVLNKMCALERTVVATGGGVPCFGDNMEQMCGQGQAVYFKMSPSKLVKRLEHGRDKRPLIRGLDDDQLLEFITQNLQLREPHYSKASMIIDCDGVSDEYIARHVENFVRKDKV